MLQTCEGGGWPAGLQAQFGGKGAEAAGKSAGSMEGVPFAFGLIAQSGVAFVFRPA